MPELVVFVVAPTKYDSAAIVPKELLDELNRSPDASGDVYGSTPDDWRPFDEAGTVLALLKEWGVRAVSRSANLADLQNADQFDRRINESGLVIIDAVFLSMDSTKVPPEVIGRLDSAIRYGKKEFCLVLQSRLSRAARDRLEQLSRTSLALAFRAYRDDQIGEFKADELLRLQVHVLRIYRKDQRLEAVEELMASKGVARFPGTQAPSFGQRSRQPDE